MCNIKVHYQRGSSFRRLITILILVTTLSNPLSAYDFMVDGICYNKNPDGETVSVTYQNTSSPRYSSLGGELNIPSSITYAGTTYSVSSIGNGAFSGCSGLTSVTIPNSIKMIGLWVFSGCSKLVSVTIPNSLGYIGHYMFSGCTSLKSVTIPNSITQICEGAFLGCSGLTSVTIPNSVTLIGIYSFEKCTGLKSLIIPNSVTSIGYGAFLGCTDLTSIVVEPDNPKYDSRNNSNAIFETESNTLMFGCKSSTIPNSITTIGNSAFYGCEGLTSIEIPNSITSIGPYAFDGCSGLKTVIIKASLKQSETAAFNGCDNIDYVFYLGETIIEDINSKSFYVADKSLFPSSSLIPMVSWNKDSFNYIQELESISPINNVVGWDYQLLETPTLHTGKGYHKEYYKFRFTRGNVTFDANIPFEYTINYLYKVTATTNDYSREYGEENPNFEVIYSGIDDYSLIETGAKATTTAKKTSNVGEYIISLSGLKFKEDNYYIEYIPAKLTVNKAPMSIKIDDKERIYGDSNPSFTYTLQGLKNGETVPTWIVKPTLSTTATKTSPVGFYDITMNEPEAKNYEITSISNGKLSINKAMLTAKANNASRLYFEDNPTFTCSYSGFKNNENSSVISKAPQIYTYAKKTTKAGQYPIFINWAEAQNYDFTYVDGTININKRTIVATTPNYSRLYQEPNPQFEVSYSGFVNDETINVFHMVPWVKCDAGYNANVGTYPIIIYNGEADNYNFDYRGGYLTVQKKEQTLTWDQDISNVKLYSNLELTAKASSQLPVSYELDNNDIANIYTAGERVYVECFAEGSVIIRAQQMGNNNWYASSRITKKLTISRFGSVDDVYADTEKCYEVKGHDLVILTDGVELFDTNGRLIYAGAPTRLPLQTGIYIIRHNGKTFKELVK